MTTNNHNLSLVNIDVQNDWGWAGGANRRTSGPLKVDATSECARKKQRLNW